MRNVMMKESGFIFKKIIDHQTDPKTTKTHVGPDPAVRDDKVSSSGKLLVGNF